MAAVVADSGNERDTLLPRRSDEESVIQFNRRERVAGYLESRITHSGVIVLVCPQLFSISVLLYERLTLAPTDLYRRYLCPHRYQLSTAV